MKFHHGARNRQTETQPPELPGVSVLAMSSLLERIKYSTNFVARHAHAGVGNDNRDFAGITRAIDDNIHAPFGFSKLGSVLQDVAKNLLQPHGITAKHEVRFTPSLFDFDPLGGELRRYLGHRLVEDGPE